MGNGIGSVVTFSKPQIAFFKKPVIVFQHKKRVEVVLNYLCENYDPHDEIHTYLCSILGGDQSSLFAHKKYEKSGVSGCWKKTVRYVN